MSPNRRFVVVQIVLAVALTCLGLLGLDWVVAEYLRTSGWEGLAFFLRGTELLDFVTGKDLSKFLIGLLLSACAGGLLLAARTKALGRSLLYVGIVQLLTTLVAGVSKNAFGRLRPFELLQSGDWSHAWFVGGSAFPSGHAGFYFGLIMPLAYAFPRLRWPLAIVSWFIVVARVNANHHFISDVAASVVLAGALTLSFAPLVDRQRHEALLNGAPNGAGLK